MLTMRAEMCITSFTFSNTFADSEEIEFVQKLQQTGGMLTKDKFLAIELMKMGKVSQDDLDMIDSQ